MMRFQSIENPARRATFKLLLLGISLLFFRSSQAADDSTVTLDQLAGEYQGGGIGNRLKIHADGRFDWTMTYFTGGDVGSEVTASGRLVAEEGAFAVHVDSTTPRSPPGLFPPRLHAVRTCGYVVLLTDGDVSRIINSINGGEYGRGWKSTRVSGLLHRLLPGTTDDDARYVDSRLLYADHPIAILSDNTIKHFDKNMLGIDNKLLVPKMFVGRILSVPLQGKVLGVEKTSMPYPKPGMSLIPIGPPRANDPPPPKDLLVWRLTVDLGAGRGVFEGMALYAGALERHRGLVKRVTADRCEMEMEPLWVNPQKWQPTVGEPVSSREVNG
jgi:hypothetical protein